MDSSRVAVPHGGGWHTRITAVERLGCCLSPSTIPACTWNRDALAIVAGVAFPPAVGPKDGIGRFREGIRRPKVAAAFQAGPELVGLPGFPGTGICEIHERAATLAAHLKVDISHEPHSSAETSGWPPSACRAVCGDERVALSPVESSLPTDLRRDPTHSGRVDQGRC